MRRGDNLWFYSEHIDERGCDQQRYNFSLTKRKRQFTLYYPMV